ncbi:hypothetical protein Q8W71_31995 [Methylobacterium sp. NEAU 140]|uniref:hypothetical protein n=1 Tax=Methylobacterium sp. NEAU 140 TaxID=3064945 RepID=UPI0027361C75|nr:hypothetical protein [Methylobacterium sp. NEAU 140]MDP4027198.1 hypothetical protein [Methylobacterium sp. NEAU 140]
MPSFASMNIEEMRRACEATRREAQAIRLRAQASARRASEAREALAEVIEGTRQTRVALQVTYVSDSSALPADQRSALPSAVSRVLAAAGMDDSDLDGLIGDLIAAYKEACALGDEAAQALLGKALWRIGHHIARQVGPKAAGVVLS